jgi:hypothetical protein
MGWHWCRFQWRALRLGAAAAPTAPAVDHRGTLPTGYCTDDGAGLLYGGTNFVQAVAERDSTAAYFMAPTGDRAVSETRLDTVWPGNRCVG